MMKTLFINIILLVLLSTSVNAQDSCKVSVNIQSDYDSALVFINGDLVGKGNVSLKLSKNKYEITVMKSINDWGSNVITDSLTIDKYDKPINLDYKFKKRTVVTSSPDAALYSADSLLGYTPIKIPLKFNQLSLTKEDYEKTPILLLNKPIQPKIDLTYIGNGKEEPFIESTLFKVLIGSAVALGATAAYLKLEADKKFDKYLETRNNDYLDETDKLDIYSGIAFGVLQVNFGALLYLFLAE